MGETNACLLVRIVNWSKLSPNMQENSFYISVTNVLLSYVLLCCLDATLGGSHCLSANELKAVFLKTWKKKNLVKVNIYFYLDIFTI